jgi:hypothetical protein
MTRLFGGLIAIVAGIALGLTELIFAPSLAARMDAHPGYFAERFGTAMVWTAAISLALVGGGLAAMLVRRRNSN